MNKVKKGDTVIALSGKDKGKTGVVLRLVPEKSRALVEGLNMIKKHVKPNPQTQQQGGIVDKEAALHLSNLAIYNPQTKKADRVGFKFLEDGKKVRYFKSNGELVDLID